MTFRELLNMDIIGPLVAACWHSSQNHWCQHRSKCLR